MKTMLRMTDQQQLADRLRELIAFQPTTGDHAASLKLLQFAKKKLESYEMQAEIRTNEAYHFLIAGTKSLTQSKLLLQSHIDVVPAPAAMFNLIQKSGSLKARGAYDMLFAVASFLVALEKLHVNGTLKQLDIGVMLSSDEEIGGFHTTKPFVRDYICDVCFLPDAGGAVQLSTSAKGILQMELAFRGKSGHAARPSSYDNPIYRLASCITALERKFPNANPSATVCSLTTIHGGNALNQVPDDATLTIDVRYVPTDDPVAIEQTVKSIAKQFNGSCKRLVCEPAFVIDSLNPFVQEFIKVYEGYTGRHVRAIEAPGSSDARFFSNKGVPVIMIRPEGGGLHGPDEYISLASLAEFTDILGIYLEKFER